MVLPRSWLFSMVYVIRYYANYGTAKAASSRPRTVVYKRRAQERLRRGWSGVCGRNLECLRSRFDHRNHNCHASTMRLDIFYS
jgi:hypothetical protein